jgi:hypothetical protein
MSPAWATNNPADYFALGKQSAKGTEATTFYFFRHLDGTGLEDDIQFESVKEGGDGQEVGLRYKTAINMDGQGVANARPEGAARIFSWALGQDTVANATIGPTACQIHTAAPVTATTAYLTADQRFADEIERVSDVTIDTLQIDGEAGRPLKLTFTLAAGGTPYQRDTASALTPTRETLQPFFYPGASFTLNGVGSAAMTKFTGKVSRNLDKDIRTTQLFRDDVLPLAYDVDLDLTLKYEDRTIYQAVHYGGGSVIPINLATGSLKVVSEFGTGTGYRFLELNWPILDLVGGKVNKLDPDGKTMYLDVTAMGRKSGTYSFYTRVQTASAGAF